MVGRNRDYFASFCEIHNRGQESAYMTCREMDLIMSSSSPKFGPDEAEHIAQCGQCQCLAAVLNESRPTPLLSRSQLDRINAALLRNLVPVKPLASSYLFFIGLASVFVALLALGVWLNGATQWRQVVTFRKIGILVSLSTCAALMALSLVHSMAPGGKNPVSPTLLPMGAFSLLAILVASTFPWHAEPHFILTGAACMKSGLTYAIAAALSFWFLLRRGAILAPGLIGATAGALSGLVGAAVLDVQCPSSNAYHILIWHQGVMLAAMAGGFAIGRLVGLRRNRFSNGQSEIIQE
jgi:hypothetical protein